MESRVCDRLISSGQMIYSYTQITIDYSAVTEAYCIQPDGTLAGIILQ